MRLFVALDIEDGIRNRIAHFMEEVRDVTPDARWVNPESLHVTLKFIGEKPEAMVKQIEAALGTIQAGPIQLQFREIGFFPNARSARVFWVGIEADSELAQLAKSIEQMLAGIGIPEEKRTYSPHLTLARADRCSGAPRWRKGDKVNLQFSKLQARLEKTVPPDFGTMTAREFFLYRSQLSNKGARYTKIARFGL
jgi:RNA 2',3'-cyclic 3'-phosphodiesterase